ncbi:MAG: metallophosphoesterase family protein, partial [Bacteroidota bacterium]
LLFCTLYSLQSFSQEIVGDFYPPTVVPDRIMLTLTEDPATSIGINWRTSLIVTEGTVQITKATGGPEIRDTFVTFTAETSPLLSDINGANYHSVVIKELAPSTKYAYRVGNDKYWSEWAHFQTGPVDERAISFIYFGDAQNDVKSMWSRTIRGAYSQMPKADFLLHAGDLINVADRDHEWGEWFYAGGWIYRMMPSIATPGNHEYSYDRETKDRALSTHWNPTFTLPENGPEGLEETVYTIDYPNLKIISLNSQAFKSFKADSAAQVKWLKDVLKKNDKKWTIVTMHHPIYSSSVGRDNIRLRNALKPLFEKHGVDIVLQGHDHTYGRGTNLPLGRKKTLAGPMYVVSVSGPKMYPSGLSEWMQRAAANTQLYQLITIEGDELRFKAYTTADELYDAFIIAKQADGSNRFIDQAPEDMEERLEIPPRFINSVSEEDMEAYRKRFKAYKDRNNKN